MKAIATLLVAASIITAAPVQAQSHAYKHEVSRASFCSDTGGMAAVVYNARLRGESKQRYEELAAPFMDGSKGDNMIRFAIDYGYDRATDAEDAYMKSWANCMDNTN